MVSEEFLEKLKGKVIHIDYLESETGRVLWNEGTLAFDWDEDKEIFMIEIETDTDFIRISEKDIQKIYLKENE